MHPLLSGLGGWPDLLCASSPSQVEFTPASGWWWRCEAAGTGSLSRGSSPQGAARSLGILGPVVTLGWGREYSTGL